MSAVLDMPGGGGAVCRRLGGSGGGVVPVRCTHSSLEGPAGNSHQHRPLAHTFTVTVTGVDSLGFRIKLFCE